MLLLLVSGARAGAQQAPAPTPTTVVAGTVFDTISGRPLRLAVIRIAETGASTLTDDGGRYKIVASSGDVRLEIRRIGYARASLTFEARGRLMRRDIFLRPLALGLAPVTITATDDLARRIIARAIARKHELFAEIHDFQYDAYVKFVMRDLDGHPDSAASVLLITETRTSAYWEQPNHYQETILARRQSSNLKAEMNLVSVGDIPNFSRDRIDLQKYSVVSPIADDALDHYAYHILDTLSVGERRVFRLAIQPRSEASPLFVGMIDVADSTYDILEIDVGVNSAVRFDYLKNVRYRQRLRDVGEARWMPYDIRLSAELAFGIPLPGLPEHVGLEHAASLENFTFDQRRPPAGIGEFRIVVADQADHADSARWVGGAAIPLTRAERAAWAHIDSLESRPPDLSDRLLKALVIALRVSKDPDFYHFNRTDGNYFGAGGTWWRIPGVMLRGKLGYASSSQVWEYRFGTHFRVSDAQRVWVGVTYHDETTSRPSLVSRDYNPTYRALFFRLDPLDYYRERGVMFILGAKLFDFTQLDLHYKDVRQSNLDVATDYSVFSVDRLQRPNPAITEGRLRSLSGTLTYDSRPLLRAKGQDYYLQRLTRTRFSMTAEVADPRIIANDFNFRRYSFQFERRQRTLNLGLTTITAAAGVATGNVPPQRYFTVDFGMKALTFQGSGFNTLADMNYAGTSAAMITVRHDFDRLLFAKSGLPFVRTLPFTLSVHGGAFWTDFTNHVPNPGDDALLTARTAYSEIGFGLGNLTPFLSPFNFAAYVTWQLSSYPTNSLVFGLAVTRP